MGLSFYLSGLAPAVRVAVAFLDSDGSRCGNDVPVDGDRGVVVGAQFDPEVVQAFNDVIRQHYLTAEPTV